MAPRAFGSVAGGCLVALVGAGMLTLGLVGQDALGAVAGLSGAAWAVLGGVVLLLTGLLLALFAFRPQEEPLDMMPAHLAFSTRMVVAPSALEPALAPVPAPAPGPRAAPQAPARAAYAQAPLPRPSAPMPPGLDEEIRELTRQISRAGVLLATGQLSDQGYAQYVGDLKRRRAELEARRVRAELGG